MPFLALFAAFLALPTTAQTSRIEDPTPKTLNLSFGVYQTDKATEMYKRFTPFLEALQEDIGKRIGGTCDIQLTIFRSYDMGIDALVKGNVDLVHMGGASYVTAKQFNSKVELLAMEHENGEKRFKGVIIVKKDSPIQTIEDLKGKRFAFGDKNSTVGRYLVQELLVDHGVFARDLSTWKYLERHDQVAGAVDHGDYDAGSVKFSTFKKANEKGTLRALATFESVTKPLVAREGLDRVAFNAVQQSLLAFKDEPALKELKISGFTSATDADYDMVRDGMRKADEFEKNVRSN